jgi:hypothetical protein
MGQSIYAGSNGDHFAGPTTSGFWGQLNNRQKARQGYIFETSSETPTSTQDWISPIVGETLGLSANRARRTAQIFNNHLPLDPDLTGVLQLSKTTPMLTRFPTRSLWTPPLPSARTPTAH